MDRPASHALGELAARVGGEVAGDGAVRIERVAPLDEAGPGAIAFFANKKYRAAYESSRASAVIVEPDEAVAPGRNLLRVKNAYLAFAKISTLFHPPAPLVAGVAREAFVHPDARVAPDAVVLPLASVGPGAVVGARSVLHPGAHVGPGARVGADCVLHANAVVRDGCTLGDRVVLQPGAVVGSDGFGYAFDMDGEGGSGPRHFKVPQVGAAVVEDDVELGANTCIDRGTLGDTVIGRGTKIDNLVQIAHNVAIGPLSIIVSQVGIAGSTRLGMGVVVGGQAGIVGHVHVGDGAKLAANAGVHHDIPAGEVHSGRPSRPHAEWLRQEAALARLPDLLKTIRRLEKEIQQLKERP